MFMTDKEKELLELIKQNLQISQNELADKLGITRSSVSVHINNLSKKGYIAGRGYVLNEMDYVTVIGAANVDILGFSIDKLIHSDSNPGQIKICSGGVGRNIAENLARLDVNTKLISTIGDDVYGKNLIEECKLAGIDMDHCHILNGELSSMYLAIMEEDGQMELALSDMSTLDKMPEEFIKRKTSLIKRSKIIVLDAGLPQNLIDYIVANFKNNLIFLDPVSIGKAKKVKNIIGEFHTIKVNKMESEFLSDRKISRFEDLANVSRYFIDKGVKRVFITLGEDGVYYREGDYANYFKPESIKVVNATGAGDAFMAGVVYCSLESKGIDYTAKFSSAMSELALKSFNTVSQTVSVENVKRIMAE